MPVVGVEPTCVISTRDFEFVFLRNDLLVVWGDDHHLTLWSIPEQKILQVDRYAIDSIKDLFSDPDS